MTLHSKSNVISESPEVSQLELISKPKMPGKKTKQQKTTKTKTLETNKKTFSTLRPAYGSRITLTSPDPSAVSTHKRSKRDTVQSDTHEVTYIPIDEGTSNTEDEVTKERKISDELWRSFWGRQIICENLNLNLRIKFVTEIICI